MNLKKLLRPFRRGIKGLVFSPMFLAQIPVIGYLSRALTHPLFQYRFGLGGFLFGSNVLSPLALGLSLLLLPYVALCNYFEEEWFRKSWKLVAAWALLHLAMGLGMYTLPGLFVLFLVGCGYKLIYDRFGLDVAFVAHFGYNSLIVIMGAVL